jgi:hypothetical protein
MKINLITIQSIAISIVMVFIIALIAVLIVSKMQESPEFFKEICSANNGTYYELANVTCDMLYPECFRMCSVPDGRVLSYYERNNLFDIILNVTP